MDRASGSRADALGPESSLVPVRSGSSEVEQWTKNSRVGGSIPPLGASHFKIINYPNKLYIKSSPPCGNRRSSATVIPTLGSWYELG